MFLKPPVSFLLGMIDCAKLVYLTGIINEFLTLDVTLGNCECLVGLCFIDYGSSILIALVYSPICSNLFLSIVFPPRLIKLWRFCKPA